MNARSRTTRRRILDHLCIKPGTPTTISQALGISSTTALNHLRKLEHQGIITGRKIPADSDTGRGRPTKHYSLTPHLDPAAVFERAPRLRIESDPRWGIATPEHVELVAQKALSKRPEVNGRRAITARHLADLTGMPYLDALGALERLAEARGQPVKAYRPDGKSATFYTGPKYQHVDTFGQATA